MSVLLSLDQIAPEIREALRSGSVALVVGAGASVSSGAPTSGALVDEMRSRFSIAEIADGMSFLDAGTEVCDTPPYGRIQLVRFLREKLNDLEPSSAYRQLPRGHWQAIFTTNYDDLIEKAYRSPARVQDVQPIHLPYGGNVLPRENHVPLFYLQGSIKEPPESDGSPVVSRGDYLHTVQIRQASMDTFRNVIANGGVVIYLGYSFGDRFLDDLLDEAARRIGNRNMPYGYAIAPEWPEGRTSAATRMVRRGVTPVVGTFEQFTELVDQAASEREAPAKKRSLASTPATGRTLLLSVGAVALSDRDAAILSENFEILDEEVRRRLDLDDQEEQRLARSFLKGESLGWAPFVQDWAFRRSSYPDVLEAVRRAAAADQNHQDKLVLVHGPAGLGKTVMSRQLARDLYLEDQFVVLLAKAVWRARPDLAAFERALDDLEQGLPDEADLPPVVVIIDEAELLEHTVASRMLRQAKVAGRNVTVVLFARTNEFFRPADGPGSLPEKWGEPTVVQVPEAISDGEVSSLIAHIRRLKLWPANRLTDDRFWMSYVRQELGSSFFDAIYSLVEDTQTPLKERVWSEYQNLSDEAKRAYVLIAATHQFGLPLKMEMLVRALSSSFAEFERHVIRSDAREVLFSEYDTSELNIFYRARTRIISSLVFERAVPSVAEQLAVFGSVVSSATGSSMYGTEEVDLVRNLLVQVLGPGGFDKRFGPDQQARLYTLAVANLEDDVLEHHFGLIELEAGRFASARSHLEKALKLSASIATPRDSLQNIENSLARVIAELAFESLSRGDRNDADGLFQEAEKRFVAARTGEFANAAAYDSHARMLARRARLLYGPNTTGRAIALSEALDVLSSGIDNVSEHSMAELQELRASTLASLGLGESAIAELEAAAAAAPNHARARYEVMIARLITEWGETDRSKLLRRALPHATLATELDPDYFDAWRVRAEIYLRLNPSDFGEAKRLLELALSTQRASDNAWVLYELAVAYFYLDQMEQSAQTFARLRRISRGHYSGTAQPEIAGIRTGDEPYEYDGRIVHRPGTATMLIECQELAAFGAIWFQARRQRLYEPRLHERVTFELAFNNRGVQAVELRKA